jgi:hypothetical protein
MYTEHVSKSGTVRGAKEGEKEERNYRVNNNETYHIWVRARHNKMH